MSRVLNYTAGVQERSGCARLLLGITLVCSICCCVAAPVVALVGIVTPVAFVVGILLGLMGLTGLPMGAISLYWSGSELDVEGRELRRWWRLGPMPRRVRALSLEGLGAIEVVDEGNVRFPRHTVYLLCPSREPIVSYGTRELAVKAADEAAQALGVPVKR